MKTTTLSLPWPPSINHYWKHRVIGRRAQIYISKEGTEFKNTVNSLIKEMALNTLTGRLMVDMALYAPTLRKYDIDNRVKSVLDALTHAGVWLDDEQVDRLSVMRCEKTPGGKILIEIREITE